jgi:GNAT superfamily N-acetyltransferase
VTSGERPLLSVTAITVLSSSASRTIALSPTNSTLLRLMTPGDIPAALELSRLAGWNQTADDWRLLLELTPAGCFCFACGRMVVATAALMGYATRLAWVGMVLTHPDHRHRGYAKQLLSELLTRADALGIPTIKLDATEQGQPLYEKLGFEFEQPIERWSRNESQNLPPARSTGNLSEWFEMDESCFGADRKSLLAGLAGRGACYANTFGYLLARGGREASYLGPCIAKSIAGARELLTRALSNTQTRWAWDLLPENQDALTLATELGFRPQRRLTRMRRGAPLQTDDGRIYSIAGFEFG